MTVTTTAAAPDLDEAKVAAFSQRLVDMLSSGALTHDDRHRPSHGLVRRDGRPAARHFGKDCPPGRPQRALRSRVARRDGHRPNCELRSNAARHTSCRPSTRHASRAVRCRRISRPPCSGSRCWAASRTRSSNASSVAAACHYEQFHRFHEVMAEESAQTVVAALTEHILPLADGLADNLDRGIDVLDIGCGSGRAVCQLAAEFPNSRFVGYDLCEDAVVGRPRRSQAPRPHERAFRDPRRFAARRTRQVRSDHGVRRHSRPGQARCRAPRDRRGPPPGRHVLDAGYPGLEQRREEHREPACAAPLHDLHDALHDRVARPGRRRARHLLGPRAGRKNARRRRPARHRRRKTSARRHELLLHRAK